MVYNLFPTSVYQKALAPAVRLKTLNKHLVQEARVIQKTDLAGRKWSQENYRRGYTSFGSLDRLHELSPYFQDLQKALGPHVASFLRAQQYDCGVQDLRLNTMWLNIMPRGAQHAMHSHPHSVISGTYYLQVDSKSSPLKIEDPRSSHFMNSPLLKNKAPRERQRFFSLRPKAGDVVLFDSWLKHEVPENSAASERLSISFNYDWI